MHNHDTDSDSPDLFAKVWKPIFFTDRNYKDTFLNTSDHDTDHTSTVDSTITKSTLFWCLEDTVPQSSVDEVRDFVGDVTVRDLQNGSSDANARRGAWIDDRTSPSLAGAERQRVYDEQVMSASALYKTLSAAVRLLMAEIELVVLKKTHSASTIRNYRT
jgi:hypothetical protein